MNEIVRAGWKIIYQIVRDDFKKLFQCNDIELKILKTMMVGIGLMILGTIVGGLSHRNLFEILLAATLMLIGVIIFIPTFLFAVGYEINGGNMNEK